MKAPDPLRFIPSPAAIRRRLSESETEAAKLRILLEVSERIEGVDRDAGITPSREAVVAS